MARTTYKLEEVIVDYEISYDITGKIYNSKPLVIGENNRERKQKILGLEKLIPIILPLAIANQTTFFVEELKNIIPSINEEIRSQGLVLDKLYELAEKESLEYYILSSQMNPSLYPNDINEMWEKVMDSINRLNANLSSLAFDFIKKVYHKYNFEAINFEALSSKSQREENFTFSKQRSYPQFGFRFLSSIIPFIKHASARRNAYRNLNIYRHAECRTYLLAALENCQDGRVVGGIFNALSKQNLDDPKIQDTIINTFDSKIVLSLVSPAGLIPLLKRLPIEKTFSILLEMLKEWEPYPPSKAALRLLEIGFPVQAIVKVILPKLTACDPKETINACHVFSSTPQLMRFAPQNEALLRIYVETLKNTQNLQSFGIPSFAFLFGKIFKFNIDVTLFKQILAQLETDIPVVLEGILSLIYFLLDRFQVDVIHFSSQQSKSKYIELLNHDKRSGVVEKAILILAIIGENERRSDYITLFLNKINFNKPSWENMWLMNAINKILSGVEYNPLVTEIYLKAFEQKSATLTACALQGLIYSNDIKSN